MEVKMVGLEKPPRPGCSVVRFREYEKMGDSEPEETTTETINKVETCKFITRRHCPSPTSTFAKALLDPNHKSIWMGADSLQSIDHWSQYLIVRMSVTCTCPARLFIYSHQFTAI